MTHLCIDDLINLSDLERFNISSNKIDTIPVHTFSFAPNLQVLDISRNRIQVFNMQDMAALKYLSIAENSIYTLIDPRNYPNLAEFDASFNPFKCDCHLKEFVGFMKNPQDISVIGLNAKEHHRRYQVITLCPACSPLKSTYRNNGWIVLKLLWANNISSKNL